MPTLRFQCSRHTPCTDPANVVRSKTASQKKTPKKPRSHGTRSVPTTLWRNIPEQIAKRLPVHVSGRLPDQPLAKVTPRRHVAEVQQRRVITRAGKKRRPPTATRLIELRHPEPGLQWVTTASTLARKSTAAKSTTAKQAALGPLRKSRTSLRRLTEPKTCLPKTHLLRSKSGLAGLKPKLLGRCANGPAVTLSQPVGRIRNTAITVSVRIHIIVGVIVSK